MISALSQAWASWKTAPGVALLAVVAFAVGIGSATAIFTVVNGVLLRPLPYPDGERFVSLYGARTTEPGTFMAMSVPELLDYEQQTASFDAFGWFRAGRFLLTAPGEPQSLPRAPQCRGSGCSERPQPPGAGLSPSGIYLFVREVECLAWVFVPTLQQ